MSDSTDARVEIETPSAPVEAPAERAAGAAVVLINGASGVDGSTADGRVEEMKLALAAAGVQAEVRPVPGDGLAAAAREAAEARAAAVIAAGGDGTVSAVASMLAGTGVPLGILPLGTLNHFARDLGIPADLPGAARVIAAGQVRSVDLGTVNGRVFINNASIGIYPTMVRRRDEMRQRLGRGKWVSMIIASVSALRAHPMIHLRIAAHGREVEQVTPFVFVGNNAYEIRLYALGRRTALDRGELCLYYTHRTGRLGLLRLALRALLGTLEQDRDFEATCLPELSIESHRERLRVAMDGELHEVEPPLHFRTWPGGLRVLAPQPLLSPIARRALPGEAAA